MLLIFGGGWGMVAEDGGFWTNFNEFLTVGGRLEFCPEELWMRIHVERF